MPGFNGTGPMGGGPMTGGGRGFCNPVNSGYRSQAFGNGTGFGFGRGFGRGMGFGRGNGYGNGMGIARGFGRGFGWNRASFYGSYSPNADEELNILKVQAQAAQNSLDAINRRISEIEESAE